MQFKIKDQCPYGANAEFISVTLHILRQADACLKQVFLCTSSPCDVSLVANEEKLLRSITINAKVV